MALLASSRLVPLWQLLLLGLGSFWGGMYVMAVKWAGVPTGQLSLSRVAPMMVLSLELLCTGGCTFAVILLHCYVMTLDVSLCCIWTAAAATRYALAVLTDRFVL
jgi:hypothetical protein